MAALLFARPPPDAEEKRKIRKLAGARHAPTDWVLRVRMITATVAGQTVVGLRLAVDPDTALPPDPHRW
ncbi:hypothetical protein GCM10011374_41120 [Kocuria dechangensis]|uniref:Uncharacterized protein n=1 Tax=Kocuria dechangensis TaxID=1176249 RepID=A0A917M369_9MICC|nr:hypothetical protein [Kocuria dechangensis]GGG72131.1 hypothetical protein GCM10011374_41120 [Kocuria dechangensis]